MKERYTLLLVIFTILGTFYPTAFGDLCSVDDQKLVTNLTNHDSLHVKKLFLKQGSYYYRPLTSLSFQFDRKFFLCQPEIMHMENILIHLGNVLLLFLIISRFLISQGSKSTHISHYWPAVITIFFGIHPLTTEPVNWISGRTDLLAGFFSLSTFMLFISQREDPKWWIDIIAAFFFLLALLSKEVAIAVLPVVALSLIWKDLPVYNKDFLHRTKRIIPFTLATVVYVWMRTGFHLAHDSGAKSAIKGAHSATQIGYLSKLGSLIKALGFYAKKIIWPFPLNFAITEINRPLCLAVGILVSIGTIYLLWKRRGTLSFFLMWCVLFIAPALLVAINFMAWTPLAERYLYIPLMGFSIALGIILTRYPKNITIVSFAIIVFAFGIMTSKRNIVWQKNITLFADTVAKSPNFALAHNEYASALLHEGKIEEAKKEYQIAAQLCGEGSAKTLALANLAGVEKTENTALLLQDILVNVKEKKLKRRLLKKLAKDLNQRILECSDGRQKDNLLSQNIMVLEELRKFDKNPFLLYRLGQLYLGQGNKRRAQQYFELACKKSNDYYTKPACKLCKKLSEELAEGD